MRSAEDANGIAQRVIEALAPPISVRDTEHNVGTGIGIALFPRDGNTGEELVRRADVALYEAKTVPYSSVHFFEDEMDAQIRERSVIETELRLALATRQIQPHYQPIFSLNTDEITGFEALARWYHPSLGEIVPNRFIPVAESCGLIRELSEYLLRTACHDARRWPSHTTLTFNISAAQLKDTSFGLRILSILGEVRICATSP